MQQNRSMLDSTIIPVLGYADLDEAVAWLCGAFGFSERLRIGDHRAQLSMGRGAGMVARRIESATSDAQRVADAASDHSTMVRVDDADAHCARAAAFGARIVQQPADHLYGERQYSVLDCGGHAWTFSQTIADVTPESWGGRAVGARVDTANSTENAIIAVEEELRLAMLAGDVPALDRLIDDALIFTALDGEIATKAMDLDAHRTGRLRLMMLSPRDRRIHVHGDTAVVAVQMEATGTFDGADFHSTLRYTRFWRETADGWRIVGGHMSLVAPS